VTADRVISAPDFRERAGAVLDAGGDGLVLHLRSRLMTGREFHEVVLGLRPRAGRARAALAVNDRVDVALAAGVRWIHLGGASMAPRDVRSVLETTEGISDPSDGSGGTGSDASGRPGASVLGRSVHAMGEITDADPPDYWMAGNVFRTGSHPDRAAGGLEWLAGLVSVARRPVRPGSRSFPAYGMRGIRRTLSPAIFRCWKPRPG